MCAFSFVLLIFFSGKVVITGAKNMQDVYNGWSSIFLLLQQYICTKNSIKNFKNVSEGNNIIRKECRTHQAAKNKRLNTRTWPNRFLLYQAHWDITYAKLIFWIQTQMLYKQNYNSVCQQIFCHTCNSGFWKWTHTKRLLLTKTWKHTVTDMIMLKPSRATEQRMKD